MNTVLIILQFVLILMFAISVLFKFLRVPSMRKHWKDYRYPLWFMDVIALLELLGVIGMITAFWIPVLLPYAAALFAFLMLGAIHAHLFRAKHNPIMASNAALMLVCSVILIFS